MPELTKEELLIKTLKDNNKVLKEQSYQKKSALQRIFELSLDIRISPEEKIEKINEVCRISGVYDGNREN
jgi:hypothetical protein